jgi:hypothetical protein
MRSMTLTLGFGPSLFSIPIVFFGLQYFRYGHSRRTVTAAPNVILAT